MGFEIKAVSDKWFHKTDEEEEECTKPKQQVPTKQPFNKGHLGISESSTRCIAFGESVLRSLIQIDFSRCKQNKVIQVL